MLPIPPQEFERKLSDDRNQDFKNESKNEFADNFHAMVTLAGVVFVSLKLTSLPCILFRSVATADATL